jgi:general secretion pathway protein J
MTARPSLSTQNVDGFTLLEALVATALMSMILAALATVAAQWLPNWNRGSARLQRYEQLALGLERIVADLGAAEFIIADRATQQVYFDGTDQSVTFIRTGLGPGAGPGLEIVRMASIDSERGTMVVRTRAPFARAAEHRYALQFNDPVVLVRAPYRLFFSYAGADRRWRSVWRSERQLPRTVQLTLRDEAADMRVAVSTSAVVHAEIPAECIVAKSLGECVASRLQPSGLPEAAKARDPSVGETR